MSNPENGPTPPDVDSEHKLATFIPRGRVRMDLVHAGRPSELVMTARLETFLAKQPDLEQREAAQIIREFRNRGYR